MNTAKIFRYGGSQAIRLPKAFYFEGMEVPIEKRDDAAVLQPVHRALPLLGTIGDAFSFSQHAPDAAAFLDRIAVCLNRQVSSNIRPIG